jgi:alkaline phosphatase D
MALPNAHQEAFPMTKLSPATILLAGLSLALIAAAPGPDLDFPLGVASGEVTHSSAVLWTATNGPSAVKLEVFDNPALSPPKVFQATTQAGAGSDFTVKLTASGLEPETTYYYQFRRGNRTSDVGTFMTAPSPVAPRSVRFAFSGDSDGTLLDGVPFFNEFEVLDAARSEGLDFFVYLGDQIYSDSFVRGLAGMGPAVTLDEYRETWKVNRGFQALTDLLKDTSIFSIWDDHEVVNDYDGQTVDPARYAAGRQAYFEYLPTIDAGLLTDPVCAGDPLFKVFHWGELVDLIILDERSCRSADVEAACAGDLAPTLPTGLRSLAGLSPAPPPGCLDAIFDPSRTYLGPVQKQAFKDTLLASTAKFKFVVNEIPIQQLWVLPYDRWEGYGAERNEVLDFIRDNGIENVLFLTTDIHANVINDVFIDAFTDPTPIGTEFVTGPIARGTFGQNVIAVGGPQGLAFLQFLYATFAGVDCQALDADAYGLVEIDAVAGTATVSMKDAGGNVLADDLSALPCSRTIGP